MQTRLMKVFYKGEDRLPYKDKAREVHYPIASGSTITGENNVTNIRFYVGEIGGIIGVNWICSVKKPNGELLWKMLPTGADDDGVYVELSIESLYIDTVGKIKIGLHGYSGEFTIEEQDEWILVHGTPTIQATGEIAICVNYTPVALPMGELTQTQYQEILGYLAQKLDIEYGIVMLPSAEEEFLENLNEGQKVAIVDEENYIHFYYIDENRELQEINLQGGGGDLSNYYTKAEANSIFATISSLSNYAQKTGNYPDMTVGKAQTADIANQVKSDIPMVDRVPYTFRSTAGESDVAEGSQVKKIIGCTLCFNQIIKVTNRTTTTKGLTITVYDTGRVTITGTPTEAGNITISGATFDTLRNSRKYLVKGFPSVDSGKVQFWDGYSFIIPATGSGIVTSNSSANFFSFSINIKEAQVGQELDFDFTPQIFDLSQMFGSPNFIPSDFSVKWFNQMFPKAYYEYNSGELISTNVIGKSTYGYNAYNKQGGNMVRVLAGEKYTLEGMNNLGTLTEIDDSENTLKVTTLTSPVTEITLTENTQKVIIGFNDNADKNTCCLHLTHSGSVTGYKPYQRADYPITFSGKGIFAKSGDEVTPNGTITKKYGYVEMSTLNWAKESNNFVTTDLENVINTPTNICNCICVRYLLQDYNVAFKELDFGFNTDGKAFFRDTRYSTAQEFKESLVGVYLCYELKENAQTTESGTPYTEEQWCDDYGTEEFDSEDTIPAPAGHETYYKQNLQNFLQRLFLYASGNPENLALKSGLSSFVLTSLPPSNQELAEGEEGEPTNGMDITERSAGRK